MAIMVMRPKDLVEFSRLTYCGQKRAEGWSAGEVIERGLSPAELTLLEKTPLKNGAVLVLGVGGGREALALAQRGFTITGLDFIPEMVEKAKENALRKGFKIKGIVQEISNLSIPENSYDIIWLSAAMYSCIPTRAGRTKMLKRINSALKPYGYFACQFHLDANIDRYSRPVRFLRKIFALLTLGNFCYEPGDMLWGNREFIHAFSGEEELTAEFREAGFKIEYISFQRNLRRGETLLLKK